MTEAKVLGKVIETKQGIFVVDPDDRSVSRELLLTGSYSLDEIMLLESYVRPEDTALVVGAHLGAVAVPLAKKCRHLVALEANPVTYRLLEMNVRLNNLANMEIVRRIAHETDDTIVEFLCNKDNTGGSKIRPKFMDLNFIYDSPALMRLKTVTLDTLCKDVKVDFVHMDIEGAEVFALRGAQRVLSEARTLSIEFIPNHLERVAGVTVAEWLAPILPHFDTLLIPRLRAQMGREDFQEMLQNMMDAAASEPAIIFTKSAEFTPCL